MKKWEYKITSDLNDPDLDMLGHDGWELVSVIERTWVVQGKGYEESSIDYYLKRELGN